MKHLSKAIQLLREHQELRPYLYRPLIIAAIVYFFVSLAGYLFVIPAIQGALARFSIAETYVHWLAIGIYALAMFFLSGTIYLSAMSLTSSFAWEELSAKVERIVYGEAPVHSMGCGGQISDSLARLFYSLTLGILSFFCGLATGGLASFAANGYLGLLDFTAAAYTRRGISFSEQRRIVTKTEWHPLFFIAGCLSWIPLINVLLYPLLVIMGTLIVAESEHQRRM